MFGLTSPLLPLLKICYDQSFTIIILFLFIFSSQFPCTYFFHCWVMWKLEFSLSLPFQAFPGPVLSLLSLFSLSSTYLPFSVFFFISSAYILLCKIWYTSLNWSLHSLYKVECTWLFSISLDSFIFVFTNVYCLCMPPMLH